MNYHELTLRLRSLYERGEAEAIARLVMEERFGLSLTHLALGKDKDFSLKERTDLENIAQKLCAGVPVQQVLGYATFMGRRFSVTDQVLIPRPETSELVQWVVDEMPAFPPAEGDDPVVIADFGTGSGCIAVSLALADRRPARVLGVDVSETALQVAQENARRLGAAVEFSRLDIRQTEVVCTALPRLSCIISNPPYVRQSERAGMAPHVVAHEPALALFVPDADPLLFYRAIARIGRQSLHPGGLVFVELNSALAGPTARLFEDENYSDICIRQDQFGKERMLRAAYHG